MILNKTEKNIKTLTSLNNLIHQGCISVSFFQLGSSDPDLTIGRNILTRFIQDAARIVVRLKMRQS